MQRLSDEESLLNAVKELIAIKSTEDNLSGLFDAYSFMREMVMSCGKDITIEDFASNGKPSFLAYRGPKRPDTFHILLNGHVDVVPGKPEQFEPVVNNGKLYGRGVYDMKAAAVVLANVFCEYIDKVPYALGLQIVTDEESSGVHGTKHQIDMGVKAEFIICGECGRREGTFEIANEAKGVATFELTFEGSSVHGAYPWRGDNAALKATSFIGKIQTICPIPKSKTRGTTISITSIVAHGNSHTQTPEKATIKIDCRFAPSDSRFESLTAIEEFIHSIDPETVISRVITYGPPMYTSSHNPLLLSLKTAAEEAEGREFRLVRQNGTSDGRYYTSMGGEACEFGIAGDKQHADAEYISLTAFHNYLETMHTFMQKTIVLELDFDFDEVLSSVS